MKKLITLLFFIGSMQTGLAQKSNTIIDGLYQKLKLAQSPGEKFNVQYEIASQYIYNGKIDSVRYLGEQILELAKLVNEDSLLSRANLIIGSYFGATGDIKQALEFDFKGLTYAENAKSQYDLWFAYKDIALHFKMLKNYGEALRYLKKSKSYLKEGTLNYVTAKNRTYSHLAEAFLGLEQVDSALRYIQLTNEVTLKEKDQYGFARMLYIFAKVYKAKGDFELAEIYYKKCIAFCSSNNIYLPYVTATTDYGQWLLDNKQFNLSKVYALSAFSKAKLSKDKLSMIIAADLLRKVYYALGQKDSAFYYVEVKEAYTDSVSNEQQQNQIQNLAFIQRIKENEELEKLSLEIHQRKQNIQYSLIGLGILVFLTLYLLLSRSFITNSKLITFFGIIALLIVFEFLNLLLHPYIAQITNHSPILMLLALVAIAALLVPFHHKAEKWATEKLVEKNKQIRLTAAKKTIEQLEKKSV